LFKFKGNFSESNRKQFNEYKEKFKHLNIELKSSKTMLEKSNASWDKFVDSFEVIEKWLEDQQHTKTLAEVFKEILFCKQLWFKIIFSN